MIATLKTSAKHICFGLLVLLIVLVGLRSGTSPRGSSTLAGLTFLGGPTPSTAGFAFTITNVATSPIAYLACSPQVRSNGVWRDVQIPLGPFRMARLTPRQTGVVVVAAPLSPGAWRVPVLWVNPPTLTIWQKLRLCLTGHFQQANGDFYTNFSTQVLP